MDTITHGITGALLGKAFFAPAPHSSSPTSPDAQSTRLRQANRVAIFAATLGAVFPDGDIFFSWFADSDLASLELHRGFTHSFLCMPLFAVALALLTRWICRRRGWATPSLPALSLVFAVGISSHIVLDLITSYGTMIWSPLSNHRAAWDLTFILDLVLTSIVLAPQIAAWAYRSPHRTLWRRIFAWTFFSLGAVGLHWLAGRTGYGFSWTAVLIASAFFALLFFLPALRQWGFRLPRTAWCRAGVAALVFYLGIQAFAHHVAVHRVDRFIAENSILATSRGALPMPPSLLEWAGLIHTPDGVWQSRFNLRNLDTVDFRFFPDAPPNEFIAAARDLPSVKTYLWFARFPVVRYHTEGPTHIVEFSDRRFYARDDRRNPFTFRVSFDAQRNVLSQGWVAD